jgi:hypothetical protein
MNRYLVACLLAGAAAAAPLAASAHVDVVVGLPLPAIGIQLAPPVPVYAGPPVAYPAPAYVPGPVAVAPYPGAYVGYYPAWGRGYWGPHGYYGHGYYGHGYYGHGWVGHGHR